VLLDCEPVFDGVTHAVKNTSKVGPLRRMRRQLLAKRWPG